MVVSVAVNKSLVVSILNVDFEVAKSRKIAVALIVFIILLVSPILVIEGAVEVNNRFEVVVSVLLDGFIIFKMLPVEVVFNST